MSLKDMAYSVIKNRIIDCAYAPGEFLNERAIIEELKISRTPFREATTALSQEGLVEIIPHKGILVTEITLKDVIDLYRIRERLEPFAVQLAMENIDDDTLESYYVLFEQSLDPSYERNTAVARDEDMHQTILKYADNRLLTQMMGVIYDHNRRIRVLSMDRFSTFQLTQQQHFEIIKQMRAKDLAAATDAMLRHIVSSKDRALEAILRRRDNYNFKL